MPILRLSEIRNMTDDELKRRLTELRAELVRLRTMAKAGGALDNPSRIRELRRTIARILTVMNEKQRGLR
ncbi:50S ribosomal protein L29 [Candidatus Bathyarchaeota archaeon]|nr:MAG: 50S ribosomal protein L29 [Candidatus Bathyarchaeota archaeon]